MGFSPLVVRPLKKSFLLCVSSLNFAANLSASSILLSFCLSIYLSIYFPSIYPAIYLPIYQAGHVKALSNEGFLANPAAKYRRGRGNSTLTNIPAWTFFSLHTSWAQVLNLKIKTNLLLDHLYYITDNTFFNLLYRNAQRLL